MFQHTLHHTFTMKPWSLPDILPLTLPCITPLRTCMNLRFLILYQPKYPSTNQNSISGGFGLKNWDDKGKIVYDADDNESIVRHHLETAVINDTETSCKTKYDWDERAFDYCDSELKPGAVCARSFEVWANSSFFPKIGRANV